MDERVTRFAKLPVTCVADGLGGGNSLHWAIRPLREEYAMCGRALTVDMPAGDNDAVLRAISVAEPGQVLVIDAKGSVYNTVSGDFMVGMAKVMGLAGIVADGSIRDIQGIRAAGLPVFCRGTTIAVGGKSGQGEVNVPIACGGVPVMPGDWIVGDADGVTVVPAADAANIISGAREKERRDQERMRSVLVSREAVCRYLDGVLG